MRVLACCTSRLVCVNFRVCALCLGTVPRRVDLPLHDSHLLATLRVRCCLLVCLLLSRPLRCVLPCTALPSAVCCDCCFRLCPRVEGLMFVKKLRPHPLGHGRGVWKLVFN